MVTIYSTLLNMPVVKSVQTATPLVYSNLSSRLFCFCLVYLVISTFFTVVALRTSHSNTCSEVTTDEGEQTSLPCLCAADETQWRPKPGDAIDCNEHIVQWYLVTEIDETMIGYCDRGPAYIDGAFEGFNITYGGELIISQASVSNTGLYTCWWYPGNEFHNTSLYVHGKLLGPVLKGISGG